MGSIFFWAFLDKLLGLGHATTPEKAWLAGGSPTLGFLKFGTTGTFAPQFQALAGNPIVDWLFMLGLLGIGLALILGIGMKIATWSGVLLVTLMYLALFPPKSNPVIDEHVVYALVFLILQRANAGEVLGFGKPWKKQKLVKNNPILE